MTPIKFCVLSEDMPRKKPVTRHWFLKVHPDTGAHAPQGHRWVIEETEGFSLKVKVLGLWPYEEVL